jgi:hypothetical protein
VAFIKDNGMNKFILFEIILFAIVVIGSLFGFISPQRTGQVFLAIGIIDLVMSMAAWRGWPMLRGNISDLAPFNKRDSDEITHNEYSLDHERPSIGFVLRVAITGIIAISIGLPLILIFP